MKTPVTRDFKETVRGRAQRDPKFRNELLRECADAMRANDAAIAVAILRDYVDADLSFCT